MPGQGQNESGLCPNGTLVHDSGSGNQAPVHSLYVQEVVKCRTEIICAYFTNKQ